MSTNKKNESTSAKLSVNLGTRLADRLDSYCEKVNRTRSDVIKELVLNLPGEEIPSPSEPTFSMLNDLLFIKRILRFLLIMKTIVKDDALKKEAYDLWQSLHQFSR